MDRIQPQYIKIPTWDNHQISSAKTFDDIPPEAKSYVKLIGQLTNWPGKGTNYKD